MRKRAAELDAEGEAYLDAGDRSRALDCFARAELRRQLAAEMEGARVDASRLRSPSGHGKVVTADMNIAPATKKRKNLNISETRAPEDPFAAACRAAGYSMRSLAKKLRITPGSLFNYRAGRRKAPPLLRQRIAQLIAFPDTPENWPHRE